MIPDPSPVDRLEHEVAGRIWRRIIDTAGDKLSLAEGDRLHSAIMFDVRELLHLSRPAERPEIAAEGTAAGGALPRKVGRPRRLSDEERAERKTQITKRASELHRQRMADDPAYAAKMRARWQEKNRRRPSQSRKDDAEGPPRPKRKRTRLPLTEKARAQRSAAQRRYRERHPERAKANQKAAAERRRAADPEKFAAVQRARKARYREANREKFRLWNRQSRDRRRVQERGKNFRASGAERFKAALLANQTYAAASAVVPQHLPDHVRDDIISAIVLACLEGSLTLAEIPTKGKEFVTSYWKGRSFHQTRSLDSPVGDGKTTFLDFLAAPEREAEDVEEDA